MAAVVVEEIEGLIRTFSDGRVERFPIVEEVSSAQSPECSVVSADVMIDSLTNVWARLYAPKFASKRSLPTLVYFHGGGFCVGSASWRCYHEFLTKLSSSADCLIMSVNYRLAPENRLPAAYDDGAAATKWIRRQAIGSQEEIRWWTSRCNFSWIFVGGDSAGAAVAHNVTLQTGFTYKGVVLIQPFFGGELRTASEMKEAPPGSALSMESSDAYWRMALPKELSRDHPWCNPLADGAVARFSRMALPPYLVFVAETDTLHDRNLEFCKEMEGAGKSVEVVVHAGVGHAFQVLSAARVAQLRTQEMIFQLRSFLRR